MKDKLRPQCEWRRGWGGRGGLPGGGGGTDRDGNTRAPGSICAPTQSPVAPQSRGSCQALGEPGRWRELPGTLAGQKPRSGQGARLCHPPRGHRTVGFAFPPWMKGAGQGWWLWDFGGQVAAQAPRQVSSILTDAVGENLVSRARWEIKHAALWGSETPRLLNST